MQFREEHPQKAFSPIFVTDTGIVMLSREEQPEKSSFSISVTDGKIINFLI